MTRPDKTYQTPTNIRTIIGQTMKLKKTLIQSIKNQNHDSTACRIVDSRGPIPAAATFPLPKAPPLQAAPLTAAAAEPASPVLEV